jgi:hypothetical protein
MRTQKVDGSTPSARPGAPGSNSAITSMSLE